MPLTPENSYDQAFSYALRALNYKAFTAVELNDRITKRGFSRETARKVVTECIRLGIINDEMFAADYASSLAMRGCGHYRIKMNLKRRGLTENLVKSALDEVAPDELERAKNALAGKLKSLSRETDFRKKREKAMRFLIGRGFKSDIVRTALSEGLSRGSDPAENIEDDEFFPE